MGVNGMGQMDIIAKHALNVFGNGVRPIVFAHGLGCDQTMWKSIVPAFEHDYKIVLFDLMGFGNSDHSHFSYENYQSLSEYAEDVIEIIQNTNTSPVTFVGHSVSAIIGILAAKRRPEIFDQLILIGPSPKYINDENYHGGFERKDISGLIEAMQANYFGWAKNLAPVIVGNPERPELAKMLEESFCRTNPDYALHFAKLTFWSDNRSDLKYVATPALVMQCSEDVIAPTSVGQYVATQMPNATFVQLAATGHCPHISHPEEVIAEIKKYVR